MFTFSKEIITTFNNYPSSEELYKILESIESWEIDMDEITIENPYKNFEFFHIEYLYWDGFKVRALRIKNWINKDVTYDNISSVINLYKLFLK